jgi:AraC-like DNA-binding protein
MKYTVSTSGDKVSANEKKIRRVIDYINAHFTENITLDLLAKDVGVSKYHLSREFKRTTGKTLFEYVIALRCKMAMQLISKGSSITESAISSGFDNLSYFSRKFNKVFGFLPSKYAKEVKAELKRREKV